jgi:acetyl-CoA decarbonylase/synthase complex subunit gamma
VADYDYGPAPYITGHVDTFAGPVPQVDPILTAVDARGALRVRLGIARDDFRVRPGLYAVGEPDDASPVLVTANYKLSFDALRSQLGGRAVWVLVLDTKGVNVWCAAGKGTFSTAELVARIRDARLEQIVSHKRVVLPQLGATGVAAYLVRAATGFSVVWGPVRAKDLPHFLDADMKASPEMRRVEFPMRERAKLVGVELAMLWRKEALAAAGVIVALAGVAAVAAPSLLAPALVTLAAAVLAVVAGAAVAPILLPWLPGRSFALKGALAGIAVLGIGLWALAGAPTGTLPLYAWGLLAAGAAVASYIAMNFTGSSTYTSPSGVEWEMRRAIPMQIVGAVVGVGLVLFALVRG